MKRITRDCRLTPEEAARYKTVRGQSAGELPDLVACHHERMARQPVPQLGVRLHQHVPVTHAGHVSRSHAISQKASS